MRSTKRTRWQSTEYKGDKGAPVRSASDRPEPKARRMDPSEPAVVVPVRPARSRYEPGLHWGIEQGREGEKCGKLNPSGLSQATEPEFIN